MPDRLDQLLDSLGVAGAPPGPPAAFLRAVRRRRFHRRIARIAPAGAIIVASCGLGILLHRGGPTDSARVPVLAAPSLPDTAAIVLARANMGLDAEHLLLPDRGGEPADLRLRLGIRWDPSQVERWVRQ